MYPDLNTVKEIVTYHAEFSPEQQQYNQRLLENGIAKFFITTTAFSRGCDFSNLRCSIHWFVPDYSEDFYQQTGRIGRDGEDAYAFIFNPNTTDAKALKKRSASMKQLFSTPECKKLTLLEGLGEPHNFEMCNNCSSCIAKALNRTDPLDAKTIVQHFKMTNVLTAFKVKNRHPLSRAKIRNAALNYPTLMEALKVKRQELADKYRFPIMQIASDRALELLANYHCCDIIAIKQCVNGIMPSLAESFAAVKELYHYN